MVGEAARCWRRERKEGGDGKWCGAAWGKQLMRLTF